MTRTRSETNMQVTHFKDICFADRSLKAEHSWVLIQSQRLSGHQDFLPNQRYNDNNVFKK